MLLRLDVSTRRIKRLKIKVRWRNIGGRRRRKKKKNEKEEKKCSDTWEAVATAIVSKESSSIIAVTRRCCCSIAMAKRRIGNAIATSQWRSDAAVASQW
ncbi:hypothetical protein GW17_00016976 [Ensete ventricosum]|nr:hypothetical protein GW17_00016976 [Ensete ventricosum]RZS10072.1 hypothetical protein BHM03_00041225 [Ensete ventricosum]